MVGIGLRFDLGRYHANPWGANVNDGQVEWPPSPWRLLRGLYSVARTNLRLAGQRDQVDSALAKLIAAGPPVFDLPPSQPAHTRHYMPLRNYSPQRPGETSLVLDAFRAVPRDLELRAWWAAELDEGEIRALDGAVRALGFLGRSESVCSGRLIDEPPPDQPAARPAAAEDDPDRFDPIELLCPDPAEGSDALSVSVAELRRDRVLLPPGARFIPYAVRREAADPPHTSPGLRRGALPELALFRVVGPDRPGIVEAVAVGQALRTRAQGAYGALKGHSSSPTLSGHVGDGPRLDQHQHAHYLAFSEAHGRRIDHLVIWAPEGLGATEVQALAKLSELRIWGQGDSMRLALVGLGAIDSLDLREILGPSNVWRSLTPFGLVRHPKHRGGQLVDSPEDQVRRECSVRGLPDPVEVSLEKGSWHRFRSSKAGGSRLARASVFGVRIEFEEEVRGPLALGALSHFGLGVFVPEGPGG